MSETTARFALPLLQAGQAQKEIDHNEAIALIDGVLHPLVQSIGSAEPPASPAVGQAWAIGTAPAGGWAGKAGMLALRTSGGWRFVVPPIGMTVWNAAEDRPARWDGATWLDGELRAAKLVLDGTQVVGSQQAAITAPAGGSVADSEARTAITQLLDRLRAHGLIAR